MLPAPHLQLFLLIMKKKLEEAGVFFVIAELRIRYRRSARYDEQLQLETSCSGATASKVEHTYQLARCSDGVILAEGSSVLACVDSEGKVRRIPEGLSFCEESRRR